MLPHVSVQPAASRRAISWHAAATAVAVVSTLATLGCAQAPTSPGVAAADPKARVAPVGYRPVLGVYSGARPAEPAPWTDAPKKEGAQ